VAVGAQLALITIDWVCVLWSCKHACAGIYINRWSTFATTRACRTGVSMATTATGAGTAGLVSMTCVGLATAAMAASPAAWAWSTSLRRQSSIIRKKTTGHCRQARGMGVCGVSPVISHNCCTRCSRCLLLPASPWVFSTALEYLDRESTRCCGNEAARIWN